MKQEIKKALSRASWQSFAIIITTTLGVLNSPEVKELVELYPSQLAFIGVVSVILMGTTKIISNVIQLKKELSALE